MDAGVWPGQGLCGAGVEGSPGAAGTVAGGRGAAWAELSGSRGCPEGWGAAGWAAPPAEALPGGEGWVRPSHSPQAELTLESLRGAGVLRSRLSLGVFLSCTRPGEAGTGAEDRVTLWPVCSSVPISVTARRGQRCPRRGGRGRRALHTLVALEAGERGSVGRKEGGGQRQEAQLLPPFPSQTCPQGLLSKGRCGLHPGTGLTVG